MNDDTTIKKPTRKRNQIRKKQNAIIDKLSKSEKFHVQEWRKKFVNLLEREQALAKSYQPPSNATTQLQKEKQLVDTLRDDEDIIMDQLAHSDQQQHQSSHHHHHHHQHSEGNGESSSFDQYIDQICDASSLIIKTPFEIIEEALVKEIQRTERYDDSFDSVPSDIKNLIEFNNIPTLKQIEQKNEAPLECLTAAGKLKTLTMLPRKELNYITKNENTNPKTQKDKKVQLLSNTEVIIRAALYHPDKNCKMQEFLVLGSQPLTALRDCMYCLNDHIMKDMRSGYFFIEGVFYNDMRGSHMHDYSQNVIEWVNSDPERSEKLGGPYSSKRMEDTRFGDLSIRIDEKYLYCHCGDCKHYLVFTDVRLINEEDAQNYFEYPVRVFQSRIRRKKCGICDIYSAKWVTYQDKHTSDEPTFFCDSCYRQFHYDMNGKLLYRDFYSFRYYHE